MPSIYNYYLHTCHKNYVKDNSTQNNDDKGNDVLCTYRNLRGIITSIMRYYSDKKEKNKKHPDGIKGIIISTYSTTGEEGK